MVKCCLPHALLHNTPKPAPPSCWSSCLQCVLLHAKREMLRGRLASAYRALDKVRAAGRESVRCDCAAVNRLSLPCCGYGKQSCNVFY